MSILPPHPGTFWQECSDVTTGYPYYWNTITNQVVWECPAELVQYRAGLLTLPPPLPPPPAFPAAATAAQQQHYPQQQQQSVPVVPTSKGGLSALASGYASESEDEPESDTAEHLEADPEFIGPKIPTPQVDTENADGSEVDQEHSSPVYREDSLPPGVEEEQVPELSNGHKDEKEGGEENEEMDTGDIMSLLDAEQPPDYQQVTNDVPSTQPLMPPPPPTSQPPQQQQPSLASLLGSYGSDQSDSEEDEEDVEEKNQKAVKSRLKPVTGQLDSSGRIMFPTDGNWQTAEQLAALNSYKVEEEKSSNAAAASAIATSAQTTATASTAAPTNSRKRRIALPGGKFNKTSEIQTEEPKERLELKDKYPSVAFVKSKTVLPGSSGKDDEKEERKTESEDKKEQKKEKKKKKEDLPALTAGPQLPPQIDDDSIEGLTVDELAEELVEKLEFFKVGEEKISSLKLLAVKIETLYSAMSAGALSSAYLKIFLENAHRRIKLTEAVDLARDGWSVRWDRYVPLFNFCPHQYTSQPKLCYTERIQVT